MLRKEKRSQGMSNEIKTTSIERSNTWETYLHAGKLIYRHNKRIRINKQIIEKAIAISIVTSGSAPSFNAI